MGETSRQYAVPALERGLDILELLARYEGGLSLSEIGRALDLSASAAFRSVVVLEQRGYLVRDALSDNYALSLKLYELAHIRPPFRRLLDVALPAMRVLASEIGQSCHLCVHDNGDLLVIADVEGPGPLNLAFRPGSRWPMRETVSGRVLLSHQTREVRDAWLAAIPSRGSERNLITDLERIAKQGYERAESETFGGIVDLGMPILGRHGAIAALTISMVRGLRAKAEEKRIHKALANVATEITKKLGGLSTTETTGENEQ
jgi:DNA-binding IclR family transcriptional regulator